MVPNFYTEAMLPEHSPTSESAALPRFVTINGVSYTVQAILGEGAMGRVELVTRSDGRQFALKTTAAPTNPNRRTEVEAALRCEVAIATVLNPLSLPGLPKFQQADLTASPPRFLMEYIPGQTTDELIGQQPLTETQLLSLIGSIGGALAAMHRLPATAREQLRHLPGLSQWPTTLIMGDVKPENIMQAIKPMFPDRPYVLLDLGTGITNTYYRHAKETGAGFATERFGTPPYVDPAYAWWGHATPQSDVYSLAATCLALGLPNGIPAAVEQEVTEYITQARDYDSTQPWPLQTLVDQLPVSDRLQSVLRRCLSLHSAERPADARALLTELAVESNEIYRLDLDGHVEISPEYESAFNQEQRIAIQTFAQLIDDPRGRAPTADSSFRDRFYQNFFRLKEEMTSQDQLLPIFGHFIRLLLHRFKSQPWPVEDPLNFMLSNHIKRSGTASVMAEMVPFLATNPSAGSAVEVLGHTLREVTQAPEFLQALTAALDPKQTMYTPDQICHLLDALRQFDPLRGHQGRQDWTTLAVVRTALEHGLPPEVERTPEFLKWLSRRVSAIDQHRMHKDISPVDADRFVGAAMQVIVRLMKVAQVVPSDPQPITLQEMFFIEPELSQLIEDVKGYIRFHGFHGRGGAAAFAEFGQQMRVALSAQDLAAYPYIGGVLLKRLSTIPELARFPNLATIYMKERMNHLFREAPRLTEHHVDELIDELNLFRSFTGGNIQRVLYNHIMNSEKAHEYPLTVLYNQLDSTQATALFEVVYTLTGRGYELILVEDVIDQIADLAKSMGTFF